MIFDVRLQDDSVESWVLLFNSQTGDYLFYNNGMPVVGRGTVSKRGSDMMVLFNSPRSGRKHKATGVSPWTDAQHNSEPAKRVIDVIHAIYSEPL